MQLNEIYKIETCPPRTEWIPELIAADRGIINALLESENTQGWFLNGVFYYREDLDDTLCKSIFQHPNCPPKLIAIAERFKPDWVMDSPALSMIQLNLLDEAGKREWETIKKSVSQDDLAQFIYLGLFENERRYIQKHYNKNKWKPYKTLVLSYENSDKVYRQGLMRNLVARTPSFIIEAFKDETQTAKILAAFKPLSYLREYLDSMKVVELELVAQRDDLPIDIQQCLASHKSVKVKKLLIENELACPTLLFKLAQDNNAKIAGAARQRLSEAQLAELSKAVTSNIVSYNAHDFSALLERLRLKEVPGNTLVEIATNAAPLWCCAATLHPSATQEVFSAAASRQDLPDWAKIGIVLNTADSEFIEAILAKNNKDLWLALSDNPHLNSEQAIRLIKTSDSEDVWCGVANRFIDEPSVIDTLINNRKKKSLWQTSLKMLLDPNTKANDLQKIQREVTPHGIVFSRLMARHPRCPVNFLTLFATYLPEDIKLNTKYALKLLEDPKSVRADTFGDWKVEEYLSSGFGYAFLYEWILKLDIYEEDVRRCISASNINQNKVRHLAVSADNDTLRRFVAPTAKIFTEYEYRMLATIGNETTRKNLIKSERLNNDLLRELLEDSDKSVRIQALKVAKQRKLKIASEGAVNTQLSSRQNGLGNKAERMELAKETADMALLTTLADDKTRDVRELVANSEHVSPELLLMLSSDPDDLVAITAIRKLSDHGLTETEQHLLQETLKGILLNDKRAEKARITAAKYINDGALLASQFVNGASELDRAILKRSDDRALLEKAFFAAQRGDPNIKYGLLACNPHLSLEMKKAFPDKDAYTIDELFRNLSNTEELIVLYQHYKLLIESRINDSSWRRIDGSGWARKIKEKDKPFTNDEIMLLFKTLHPRIFCNLLGSQLTQLTLPEFIEVSKTLVVKVPDEVFSKLINWKSKYSESAVAFMLKLLIRRKSMSSLASIVSQYPIPEDTIEVLLGVDFRDIHHSLAYNQSLQPRHIDALIANEDVDVRCHIAGYQQLNDDQLRILCSDSSHRVSYYLATSEVLDVNRLPTWILCKAYEKVSRDEAIEKVRNVLEARGVESVQVNMTLPQVLAHHDIKISVQNFYKKLMDNGLVESVDIVVDYYGKVRKKCFTEEGVIYGHDTNDQGDKFIPVFYPYNFKELCENIGLRIS